MVRIRKKKILKKNKPDNGSLEEEKLIKSLL